jgi:hypothetical protein
MKESNSELAVVYKPVDNLAAYSPNARTHSNHQLRLRMATAVRVDHAIVSWSTWSV